MRIESEAGATVSMLSENRKTLHLRVAVPDGNLNIHQGAEANQTKKFDCSRAPHVKGNVNARGTEIKSGRLARTARTVRGDWDKTNLFEMASRFRRVAVMYVHANENCGGIGRV